MQTQLISGFIWGESFKLYYTERISIGIWLEVLKILVCNTKLNLIISFAYISCSLHQY
jgi:hypothetical protein